MNARCFSELALLLVREGRPLRAAEAIRRSIESGTPAHATAMHAVVRGLARALPAAVAEERRSAAAAPGALSSSMPQEASVGGGVELPDADSESATSTLTEPATNPSLPAADTVLPSAALRDALAKTQDRMEHVGYAMPYKLWAYVKRREAEAEHYNRQRGTSATMESAANPPPLSAQPFSLKATWRLPGVAVHEDATWLPRQWDGGAGGRRGAEGVNGTSSNGNDAAVAVSPIDEATTFWGAVRLPRPPSRERGV